MKFNPALERMSTYPFVRLEDAKRAAAANLGELIDFGVGDPEERTPEFIRQALIESIPEKSSYPKTAGLPETRAAIAAWCKGRFGVKVDADTEVLPSSGSREAIFSLAQIAVDRSAEKNIVVTTEPGYPIPLRSAELNGCRVVRLPLEESNAFLPALESIDDETWKRIALFWVNYPNNPTGAVAPLAFHEELATRAAEHDFLVASDRGLQRDLLRRTAALGSRGGRSKPRRSLQHAQQAIGDDRIPLGFDSRQQERDGDDQALSPPRGDRIARVHPARRGGCMARRSARREMRSVYGAKRAVIGPFLHKKGLRIAGGEATIYLWVATPDGEPEETFALRLLQRGVVVAPGAFFGDPGRGYVRMALVPTLEQCHKAVDLLDEII